jgi:hypothetical protein
MFLPTFCVFFLKWETGMDLNVLSSNLGSNFFGGIVVAAMGPRFVLCSLITYSSSCRSISTTNLIYDTPLKRQKKSSTTRFVPHFFGKTSLQIS